MQRFIGNFGIKWSSVDWNNLCWHVLGYTVLVDTKVHLLTFDLVLRQSEVKSAGTTLEFGGYGPLNTSSSGAFH